MTTTYEPIATTTLGSANNTVEFTSIPGTYTDLVLIINATRPAGFDDGSVRFNGDTGSNYSSTLLTGNGSTAGGNTYANQTLALNLLLNAEYSPNIVHIMNYANTTKNKVFITRANVPADGVRLITSLWRNTSAITSITLVTSGNSDFGSGSMFTLYGIKAE